MSNMTFAGLMWLLSAGFMLLAIRRSLSLRRFPAVRKFLLGYVLAALVLAGFSLGQGFAGR